MNLQVPYNCDQKLFECTTDDIIKSVSIRRRCLSYNSAIQLAMLKAEKKSFERATTSVKYIQYMTLPFIPSSMQPTPATMQPTLPSMQPTPTTKQHTAATNEGAAATAYLRGRQAALARELDSYIIRLNTTGTHVKVFALHAIAVELFFCRSSGLP